MKRIIEKSKTYQKGAYSTGLLRSIDIMITYCEKQIAEIKKDNAEPNTPRQISNGGKLKAFNKILLVLKARHKNIELRCR